MLQVAEHGAKRPIPDAAWRGDRPERRARGSDRPVLLIEDHPGDALLAKRALADHPSFVLERAATLAEASACLAERPFAAVLLDLMLPDGSRLDALRRVRAEAPDVPIVALTGLDDEELARACIDAGAQDYIRKAELSAVVLPRVIEHAIARQRAGELSRRLELAEQHAALGRISMNVAHEINNQAAGALSSAEHARELVHALRQMLPPAGGRWVDELDAALSDQITSIRHVAEFVAELKNFGRLGDDSIGPVDVDVVVTRAARMLENRLSQVARVELDLAARGAKALGSDQKLTQVVVNLLVNAVDAIEEGSPEAHRITIRTERRSTRIAIAVADTGRGLDPSIRARLFEPFFTSKPAGRGTGLGLAICQEIVVRLGGHIDVESEPGRGATFTVVLPAADDALSEQEAEAPRPANDPARVLLIDDEKIVRRALSRLLALTHEVEAVEGGAAGIARLDEDPSYDVIVCDIMMPDVDGPAVAEALAVRHPELLDRLIFLSGGAFTERARSFLAGSDYPVIEKPATREQLLAAIDAVRRRQR